MKNYFFGGTFIGCGVAGACEPGLVGVAVMGAGPAGGFDPAGTVCFAGVFRSKIVALPPALRIARIESANDVHINTTADMVVAFDSSVAEPRGPNAVCEPIPPNAPARSAAFPLCSRITMIRNKHTTTWMAITR